MEFSSFAVQWQLLDKIWSWFDWSFACLWKQTGHFWDAISNLSLTLLLKKLFLTVYRFSHKSMNA